MCKYGNDNGVVNCGQQAALLLDANRPRGKFFTDKQHTVRINYVLRSARLNTPVPRHRTGDRRSMESRESTEYDFIRSDAIGSSAVPKLLFINKNKDTAEGRKVVSRFVSGIGKAQLKKRRKTKNRNQDIAKAQLSDEILRENKTALGHKPVFGCTAIFDRRFTDQEFTSTDENYDDAGSRFPAVLPITVRGLGSMAMVSDLKRPQCPLVLVRQSSLDVEQLCSKAAEAICEMEGCKFWFFSDYDNDVVKVCQATGQVLGVLFIKLNADYLAKWSKRDKADLYTLYETACLYLWNPSDGVVYLEGYSGPKMAPMSAERPWSPARKEANALRSSVNFLPSQMPRWFVHSVKDGMLSKSADLILDHENLIGFNLKPGVFK